MQDAGAPTMAYWSMNAGVSAWRWEAPARVVFHVERLPYLQEHLALRLRHGTDDVPVHHREPHGGRQTAGGELAGDGDVRMANHTHEGAEGESVHALAGRRPSLARRLDS